METYCKSQQRICEFLCEASFYMLTTVTHAGELTCVCGGGGNMKREHTCLRLHLMTKAH